MIGKKKLDALCKQYPCVKYVNYQGDSVRVLTPKEQWYIYIREDGQLVLMHRNTEGKKRHYHFQGCYRSLEPAIEYIYRHYEYKYMGRLEKLFYLIASC